MRWIRSLFILFRSKMGQRELGHVSSEEPSLSETEWKTEPEETRQRLFTIPKSRVEAFLETMERDTADIKVSKIVSALAEPRNSKEVPILEAIKLFSDLSTDERSKFIEAAEVLKCYSYYDKVLWGAETYAKFTDFCRDKAEEARQIKAAEATHSI